MTALRISFVEGVNPARWLAVWNERHPDSPAEYVRVPEPQQLESLLAGEADVAIVRGDIDDPRLHRVRLYEERAVVAAVRDHPIAVFDQLELADLGGETVLDIAALSYEDAVAVVESGAGLGVMPMSVARLHGTGRSIARPVTDAPGYAVSLVWLRDRDGDDVQDFVGIARGRRATSSRGDADAEPEAQGPARAAKPAGRSTGRSAAAPNPRRPRPAHRIAPKPRPRRGRR